jgi:hypothetical protein
MVLEQSVSSLSSLSPWNSAPNLERHDLGVSELSTLGHPDLELLLYSGRQPAPHPHLLPALDLELAAGAEFSFVLARTTGRARILPLSSTTSTWRY